jgi:hypothetical protein
MTLVKDSGLDPGQDRWRARETWIQNAGFAWRRFSLVPLGIALCWFGMNNLKTVSPNYGGNALTAFAKITVPLHPGLDGCPRCSCSGSTCRQAHRPGCAEHVGRDSRWTS